MKTARKLIAHIKSRPDRLLIYPVLFTIILVTLCMPVLFISRSIYPEPLRRLVELLTGFIIFLVVGELLVYPWLLTAVNLWYLAKKGHSPCRLETMSEAITIPAGIILSLFYLGAITEIQFADWPETLYNSQIHTPIATWTMPTILVLAVIALLGYLALRLIPLGKQPPLVTVLLMSAVYIGCILCILWIVQISFWEWVYLLLFPFNFLILAAKTIKQVIWQWQELHPALEDTDGAASRDTDGAASEDPNCPASEDPGIITALSRLLHNSGNWPWLALLLMLPLLGLVIMVLTLFGQKPDDIIQAWTQTSQWRLSQQVSPPNLYYDEHYLCTAAAGGHKKVVKPLRMGVRHGHAVVVNRQLCIANAFEQILEERLPRTHRIVRRFYDTYGFPIARHIRTPLAADVTYILMKPLEWLFLAVIYLCDTKPENRISMQYISPMGTKPQA